MTRTWSEYQQNIFNFVEYETGNAIVSAVAGSGKSTTIVEAMKLVKGSTIFLAFNKSIQTELQLRGVNARTYHSLTLPAVSKYRGGTIDSNKLLGIVKKYQTALDPRKNPLGLDVLDRAEYPMFSNDQNFWDYGAFARKLVGLARNMGVGCLIADEISVWQNLCEHHDLAPEKGDIYSGIKFARELLKLSNASFDLDFDDMLYMAVLHDLNLPQYDVVFVDEAQDTNPIQIAIIRKVLTPGGRLIAVGDEAQAIYGFRGAGSDSMREIAEAFDCTSLPLSISYRCPTSVVQYARQWENTIEAAPNAPAGTVQTLYDDWEPTAFKSADIVLCRRSAPLITLAYQCIRANVRCYVMGRDIGEGLLALVKKMGSVGGDVDELVVRLERYLKREVAKLDDDKDASKIEALNDKVGSLLFLCDILTEDKRTIDTLNQTIKYLFAERDNATRLCTIHKAKGLEADTVYWYGQTAYACDFVNQEWQQKQEANLKYVAATRAKCNLVMIEPPTAEE